VNIETFTEPQEGLEFIQENYAESSDHAVLFLDIDMPKINGWEFLAQYEKFSNEVKMKISIYLLSISLDHRDRNRAGRNKNVKGYITKPLTKDVILSIAGSEFEN
jgi:CheY-like chemotaxis protein